MGQLETTAGRYRSLRISAVADGLPDLLAQAEANEASYLVFADMLIEHEARQRDANRIEPPAWPTDVLSQLPTTKDRDIDSLLPLA